MIIMAILCEYILAVKIEWNVLFLPCTTYTDRYAVVWFMPTLIHRKATVNTHSTMKCTRNTFSQVGPFQMPCFSVLLISFKVECRSI